MTTTHSEHGGAGPAVASPFIEASGWPESRQLAVLYLKVFAWSLSILTLFHLLAIAAFGQATPRPKLEPLPAQAPAGWKLDGDAARGAPLYAKRCALCHGEGGRGDGKLGATMEPNPGDLTDARRMGRWSDWDLYRLVRDGGPALGLSSKMLGWGRMAPDPEVRDMTAFARSLSQPAKPKP